MKIQKNKPLVYSCSGSSSAAQMANAIAVKLNREEKAEMSCIAGVGGNVKKLVKTALSGRSIVAIDGCPLACVRACLSHHNVSPDYHIVLTQHGVKKMQNTDFDSHDADNIYNMLVPEIQNL